MGRDLTMGTGWRLGWWGLLCCLFASVLPHAGEAQQVRISGTSSFQYVEMRPLVTDSVPSDDVFGEGLFKRALNGRLVRCLEGERFCRFTRSDDPVHTIPALQDLNLSVWGFGRGLRAYAQLRSRAVVGGVKELWPQAEDHLDVLVAYLELSRSRVRLRTGRLWKVSGLGYYSYDGGSALFRPSPRYSVEIYGGWSLARGLNEPRTSGNLKAVESFSPDDRAQIWGIEATGRPWPGVRVASLYQREIRNDRDGLFSERWAADASMRRGRGVLEGSLEVDLATEVVNEAQLRAWWALNSSLTLGAHTRLYRPFFELWTIWGAFDPIGFTEANVRALWRNAESSAQVEVAGGYRTYEETNTSSAFGTFRDSGWHLSAAGVLTPHPRWQLQARYGIDINFGAAKTEAALRAQRSFESGSALGVSLQTFQRLFEFRVTEGTVFGAAADGSIDLGPRARLMGSVAIYRHLEGDNSPEVDWSQVRGTLQINWTVGAEPGLSSLPPAGAGS